LVPEGDIIVSTDSGVMTASGCKEGEKITGQCQCLSVSKLVLEAQRDRYFCGLQVVNGEPPDSCATRRGQRGVKDLASRKRRINEFEFLGPNPDSRNHASGSGERKKSLFLNGAPPDRSWKKGDMISQSPGQHAPRPEYWRASDSYSCLLSLQYIVAGRTRDQV